MRHVKNVRRRLSSEENDKFSKEETFDGTFA